MKEKIGRYSGNRRQDTSSLEEPDSDDEISKKRWLEREGRELPIKRRLRMWRANIKPPAKLEDLIIHMVGQSHIDIAWMWRFAQTRKKAQVTFKKAIIHAKMFPDTFCFALSEPILLDWIKDDNPQLFKEIQETVKAGGIELVGGSYVEPDCMMPSGEAFVRQRLYGMKFFKENFNTLPDVEWFLDSFGYNFGIPQILVKSGARYFWTSKITWNRDTVFPFVNFWWQGPDGTRLLTTNFQMGTEPLSTWDKYEIGHYLLKKDGKELWNYTMGYSEYKDHVDKSALCPHVGCFFGKGDGGHGPTHKEVAYANEQAKTKMFKWSRVKGFFQELDKYSDKFPIWNDELYLEYHRGCFSNHAEVKRHNRKYENEIVSLETLALLTSLINENYEYPYEIFEKLWKITLKNQFHDVLPGSSIAEVYDDCWDDWEEQDEIISKAIQDISISLSNEKKNDESENTKSVYLLNPSTWERTSRVFIPVSLFNKDLELNKGKPFYARLEVGNNKYICQPIAAEPEQTIDRMPAGWWTVIKLKPLSIVSAKLTILDESESKDIEAKSILKASEDVISNDITTVKIDKNTGAMLEVLSKGVNDENNLLSGKDSNLTFGFLDRMPPDIHAWNITPKYWNHPKDLPNNVDVDITVTEIGPIFITLEISRTLGISPVVQKITLFQDCPEVFLEYLTDWQKRNIMLKVLYSTATNADIVTADMAYCFTQSKTKPEVPCDIARWEKICQKYFDLSTPDKKWGIAMLNEGKYAYDVNGGDMRLTMLRVCKFPNPAQEAWVLEERKLNVQKYHHKVPRHSGIGPFKCRYALLPHKGGAILNADGTPNPIVKRKAEEFNNPVIVLSPKSILEDNPYINISILEISPENVYLGAFKMKEWEQTGSFIARFIEGSGISALAEIKFNSELSKRITSIKAVDLLEREVDLDFEWNNNDGMLSFKIKHFEICSFEIRLAH